MKKQIDIIKRKYDKHFNLSGKIEKTCENYNGHITKSLLCLPLQKVEEYAEVTKKELEDLVYWRHNVGNYETVINSVSSFLAELTNIDEMNKLRQEFNNEINQLKRNNLVRQVGEID